MTSVCVLVMRPTPSWAQTQAQLLYPASGATNVDVSQPMLWTSVAGAQAYELYLGSSVGGKDILDSGQLHTTSFQPSILPAGQVLFARLWTELAGRWIYIDTQFSTVPLAMLTTPLAGATAVTLTPNFAWTPVPGAQAYYLYVGSAVGAKDLVDTGETPQTSFQVGQSLPGGQTLYARLWTKLAGTWRYRDSLFGTIPTATLLAPSPGSLNVDPTQPLGWTTVPGAQAYTLYIGTTPGASDVVNSGVVQQTFYQGQALPAGRTLYARVWTKFGNVWLSQDSQFASAPVASLTAPANGANNVALAPTFTWSAVPGAQAYELYVGSSSGAADLVDSHQIKPGTGTALSFLSPSLPGGQVLYARLWTEWNGVWQFLDSQFQTAALASLTAPPNGSLNVNPLAAFTWTPVPAAQVYYLYVGSAVGAKDIVDTGEISATTYQASPLPGARTLYARLWTKSGNAWAFVDSQFTTASVATLTSALPGAVNVNPTSPFTWLPVAGAQAYDLYLGTSLGGSDLVNSGQLHSTSYTPTGGWDVPATDVVWDPPIGSWSPAGYAMIVDDVASDLGLPLAPCVTSPCYHAPLPPRSPGYHTLQMAAYDATGQATSPEFTFYDRGDVVYVRLWTEVSGVWKYVDSQLTPANLAAQFTYPTSGAVNIDPRKPFSWAAMPGADSYSLTVGLAIGGSELASVSGILTTSYAVPALTSVAGGSRVFAHLGTHVQGVWRYSDVAFNVLPLAHLSYPTDGLTQVPRATSFSWTTFAAAQTYYLYVGTQPGMKDVVDSGEVAVSAYRATNLPASTKLYVRLWTKLNGTWYYIDSTFVTTP
jgi:hypothetical protein